MRARNMSAIDYFMYRSFNIEEFNILVIECVSVIFMELWVFSFAYRIKYSKTCRKRNAIVPVFFFRFHRFPFYKGLCFNKTKYKKYDRLGLQ